MRSRHRVNRHRPQYWRITLEKIATGHNSAGSHVSKSPQVAILKDHRWVNRHKSQYWRITREKIATGRNTEGSHVSKSPQVAILKDHKWVNRHRSQYEGSHVSKSPQVAILKDHTWVNSTWGIPWPDHNESSLMQLNRSHRWNKIYSKSLKINDTI